MNHHRVPRSAACCLLLPLLQKTAQHSRTRIRTHIHPQRRKRTRKSPSLVPPSSPLSSLTTRVLSSPRSLQVCRNGLESVVVVVVVHHQQKQHASLLPILPPPRPPSRLAPGCKQRLFPGPAGSVQLESSRSSSSSSRSSSKRRRAEEQGCLRDAATGTVGRGGEGGREAGLERGGLDGSQSESCVALNESLTLPSLPPSLIPPSLSLPPPDPRSRSLRPLLLHLHYEEPARGIVRQHHVLWRI